MSNPVEMKNPFPGPQPYRAADRERFFGRDALVKKLANQLLARSATTLFGPSGAGKSSIMQAGVIPRLQETHDFQVVRVDGWPPGEAPLQWLVRAIYAELDLGAPPEETSGLEALDEAMAMAERRSERPILIYMDQLEQLLFPERNEAEVEELISSVDRLARAPIQGLQMVLSLREDYLGRFRDRARDRRELLAHGSRLGPLTVAEMVKAVCQTAKTGTPPQKWDAAQITELMREVRVPGQGATDEAEVQAAYAQIVCRALFQQRAEGEPDGAIEAEAILRRYLDATLDGLGPLAADARRLLENDLVTADGSRTLRTEKELLRLIPQERLSPILKALEGAAILHAEAHQGSRYFEIGHDWLARKVYEERAAREREEAQRQREAQQVEALRIQRAQIRRYAIVAFASIALASGAAVMGVWARAQQKKAEMASDAASIARSKAEVAEEDAKRKAIEASDARLLAGFRELKNSGQLGWATKLLSEVQEPEATRGWISLASDMLGSSALQVTLRGHEKALHAALWSPDGKRVLTASTDKTARVWNSNGSGAPLVLAGHEGPITVAIFRPDGERVLSASEDGTARIWDIAGTGAPIVLDAHAGAVSAASWSPDGTLVVTASADFTARVWSSDGKPLAVFSGHSGPISTAVFLPDGNRVLTASYDGTARVFAVHGGGTPTIARGHDAEIYVAAPSPDGTRFVTASADGTARVWASSGKGKPIVLEGHDRAVRYAAWSPDGMKIGTASADGTARLWSAEGKGDPVVLSGHSSGLSFIDFRPDGRYIVTASRDQTARIWPASGGTPFVLTGHDAPVLSARWSPDGSRLVTATSEEPGRSPDSAARIFRPERLESLPRERRVFYHSAFIVGNVGERVVSAYDDQNVRLFRIDGAGEPLVFPGHDAWVTNAASSLDGERIVTVSLDATARIVRVDGAGEPVVLRGAKAALRYAAFSPDGTRVVTTSDDGNARVYQADGSGEFVLLSGHADSVVSAAWSPDGKRIVTASLDHNARIFRADGGGDSVLLKGHGGAVFMAAWSADGARVLTASEDATAQVWSAETGAPLTQLDHESPVLRAIWSPDGKRIVTSSVQGGLRIYRADGSGEPIVIDAPSPILAMAFLEDGKRILTVREDNTTRVFTIDVGALAEGLRAANDDCLPVEMREVYLGEPEEKARDRYTSCERAHSRGAAVMEGDKQ